MQDLTYLTPPIEGTINVLSLTAETASSATQIFTGNSGMELVNFVAYTDTYVIFGDSSIVDPDPDDDSSTGRCFLLPAKTIVPFHCNSVDSGYFKAYSEEDGSVRWYAEKLR